MCLQALEHYYIVNYYFNIFILILEKRFPWTTFLACRNCRKTSFLQFFCTSVCLDYGLCPAARLMTENIVEPCQSTSAIMAYNHGH